MSRPPMQARHIRVAGWPPFSAELCMRPAARGPRPRGPTSTVGSAFDAESEPETPFSGAALRRSTRGAWRREKEEAARGTDGSARGGAVGALCLGSLPPLPPPMCDGGGAEQFGGCHGSDQEGMFREARGVNG